MSVSKNAKIDVTPNVNFKICVTPNADPNASLWNIGCVGSQNFRIGHVHFMLFVLISFALGTQRKPSLQWNMGLSLVWVVFEILQKWKGEYVIATFLFQFKHVLI